MKTPDAANNNHVPTYDETGHTYWDYYYRTLEGRLPEELPVCAPRYEQAMEEGILNGYRDRSITKIFESEKSA